MTHDWEISSSLSIISNINLPISTFSAVLFSVGGQACVGTLIS